MENFKSAFCYNTLMLRELLLEFSTPLLVMLIVGGSALLGIVSTYLVRRFIDERIHQANNEVAGFIFAAVGVIYGVLIAFMVLVVWEEFQTARVIVEQEANLAVNIFRLGQALPEPDSGLVQETIIEYTQQVIQSEWHTMETGQASESVDAALEKLWTVHRQIDFDKAKGTFHPEHLFKLLNELGNTRRLRLLESRTEIPPLMYSLLISGAVVTIGFTLFLRAPNLRAHLLMAGMFAGLVAFVLLLIVELDNPFLGEIRVQPTAFQQALELLTDLRGK